MQDKVTETAQHFRRRAESLRTISEGIFDHQERKKLVEIAEEYDRWAREKEGPRLSPMS